MQQSAYRVRCKIYANTPNFSMTVDDRVNTNVKKMAMPPKDALPLNLPWCELRIDIS